MGKTGCFPEKNNILYVSVIFVAFKKGDFDMASMNMSNMMCYSRMEVHL